MVCLGYIYDFSFSLVLLWVAFGLSRCWIINWLLLGKFLVIMFFFGALVGCMEFGFTIIGLIHGFCVLPWLHLGVDRYFFRIITIISFQFMKVVMAFLRIYRQVSTMLITTNVFGWFLWLQPKLCLDSSYGYNPTYI